MRLPVIEGIIDRRVLVNYRIDPEVAAQVIPDPFRPKIAKGSAVGGICLIRLREIRPKRIPSLLGIASENAAHRFAVEWDENGERREGVYIPRRDTSSRLNALVGGRIFPGVHHRATFECDEHDDHIAIDVKSHDGSTLAGVSGQVSSEWQATPLFSTLGDASAFFEQCAVGYSPGRANYQFDGLELATKSWSVQPILVEFAHSSYFEDEAMFPSGSVCFDHALLMRDIAHEWRTMEPVCCAAPRHETGA